MARRSSSQLSGLGSINEALSMQQSTVRIPSARVQRRQKKIGEVTTSRYRTKSSRVQPSGISNRERRRAEKRERREGKRRPRA